MIDEKILEVRRKLNESVTNDDYSKTYKLSVELDKLIIEYYTEKLQKK